MNNKTNSLKIINSIIKFLNEGFDSKKSLEMTAKELKLNHYRKVRRIDKREKNIIQNDEIFLNFDISQN